MSNVDNSNGFGLRWFYNGTPQQSGCHQQKRIYPMSTNDTISRSSIVADETATLAEAFEIVQALREKFHFDGYELYPSAIQDQVEKAIEPSIDFFDINNVPDVLPDLEGATQMTQDFGHQLAVHAVQVAFESYGLAERMDELAQEVIGDVIEERIRFLVDAPESFTFDVTLYDRKGRVIGSASGWENLAEAHHFGTSVFNTRVVNWSEKYRSFLDLVNLENVLVDHYSILICEEESRQVVISLKGRD